jgi:hypothetical protein
MARPRVADGGDGLLRRIIPGPQREELWETVEDCTMSFITFSLHEIVIGCSNQVEYDGWFM